MVERSRGDGERQITAYLLLFGLVPMSPRLGIWGPLPYLVNHLCPSRGLLALSSISDLGKYAPCCRLQPSNHVVTQYFYRSYSI